jgi:hypothetical protein
MKLGLESRTKSIVGCTLLSLAFLLLGRSLSVQLFSSPTPNEFLSREASKIKVRTDSGSLDPTLHLSRLRFAESALYIGRGRNIFRVDPEPAAAKTPAARGPEPPKPAPPPARPPIALRYFGFVTIFEAPRKGFFGNGDAVFVATEGEIIDRRYRILKMDSSSVEVEDLIEHSTHKLSLPG